VLKPGDIVTDVAENSCLYNMQGEVIMVQLNFWDPPTVLVQFHSRTLPEYYIFTRNRDRAHEPTPPNFYIEEYAPDELRLDTDWNPSVIARRIFGTMHHSVYTIKIPFDSTKLCMVKDCVHTQKYVVWVNIHGSVMNVYVCEAHFTYYTKRSCMDSFPLRNNNAPVKTG